MSTSDPAIDTRVHSDAHAAAAMRVGGIVALWLVVRALMPSGGWDGGRVVVDAILALGTWWGLAPGRSGGGPEFMHGDHWTKLLSVPLLLGGALAAFGAWRILSGAV